MLLHPALENLIKFVNDDKKPYTKENLSKWCSALPKEDREFFMPIIKEDVSREDLGKILSNMIQPGSSHQPAIKKNVPSEYKKGDVLMHPVFQHPYILLEKKKDYWICCLITSEEKCPEILEPCRSRFFDGYITRTMFTTVDPIGRYIYPFENTRQLNLVTKKLKLLFT